MSRIHTATLATVIVGAVGASALVARPIAQTADVAAPPDTVAQLAAARAPKSIDALKDTPLEIMSAFVGNWEIDSNWSDGSGLWARNEYTVGTGGRFLFARTFARDADGDVYERYFSAFAHNDKTGTWSTYGFTYDGTTTVVEGVNIGGTVEAPTIESGWSNNGQDVRQTVTVVSPDTYDWKVFARPTGADDDAWAQIMDGTWRRVD